MLTETDRNDTEAILVDPDGPPMANGRIVPELDTNGQPTGFKLFIPTEEEEERMARHIADELDTSEREYAHVWERMTRNIEAYEALPSGDKDDFLTLPLAKRDVNHLTAFFVNRISNKRPIASVVPEEYGIYEVAVPTGEQDPFTGQTLSKIELRTAEDLAEAGERLLDFYLKGPKLGFHRFLYTVVADSVIGASPVWGKTCYERVLRPQLVPKWRRLPNGMVTADGYHEVERVVGSPHKLVAQSGFNVMMASPWLDPQEAEWVAEHVPTTMAEARHKVRQNEWYLCNDEKFDDIRKAVSKLDRYEHKNNAQEIRADRKVDTPREFLDVWNVWIYWPVVFDDESGQTMEGIFSLIVPFERTTGQILACPLNPYAHGRRNLVPYVQRPRTHQLNGYSTCEDVVPLQKVQTRLFHSQVQNAMLANTVWTKVRPGSTAWQWLKSNEIRARAKVPVQNDTDLKSEVLGRELRSLAPEISAIDGWSKQLTVSDTVKGATLLGRTSRAAISLVQEAGLTVPNMDLDFIKDSLSTNIEMLYQNIGQWAMYGEEIPYQDPETRAVTMRAVEFPIDGLNRFSVRVTASSDEETAQFEFERDLGLAKLQGEKFAEAAQLIGPMIDPQAPPVIEEFQKPMLMAQQALLARIFQLAKMDPKKYTFTEKRIDEILARHREWIAAEQQRKMEEQIAIQAEAIRRAQSGGGGEVVSGPFGGGPVPAAGPDANAAGPPGVGAPSGVPDVPPAPPGVGV